MGGLEVQEVSKDPLAGRAGALGVKLGPPEVPAPDNRADRSAIVSGGERVLGNGYGVAVHEIGVVSFVYSCEQRISEGGRCSVFQPMWGGTGRSRVWG